MVEDERATQLRQEIQEVRERRTAERTAHAIECRQAMKNMAWIQDRMKSILKTNNQFMNMRDYRNLMVQVYGSMKDAPPRYALDQQAALLSYTYQGEVFSRELVRRNEYKTMMVRYLVCEQSVLRNEKEELETANEDIRALSKTEEEESDADDDIDLLLGTTIDIILETSPAIMEDDSSSGGSLNLSSSSFLKRSFDKGRQLHKQMSLRDMNGGSSRRRMGVPRIFGRRGSANE